MVLWFFVSKLIYCTSVEELMNCTGESSHKTPPVLPAELDLNLVHFLSKTEERQEQQAHAWLNVCACVCVSGHVCRKCYKV